MESFEYDDKLSENEEIKLLLVDDDDNFNNNYRNNNNVQENLMNI